MRSFIFLCVILCFVGCVGDDAIEQEVQIIRFNVQVGVSAPVLVDQGEVYEYDRGVLILPTTYSKEGKPTKMIIYCHGGGGSVSEHSSQVEEMDICKYFVSLGFAVMDMAGMPESYSSRLKIDHYRCLGNIVAIRSYQKGYQWIIDNYNIDKQGCLLGGGSNGGLTATNLALHSDIPFVAQAALSPLLNMRDSAWKILSGAISGGEFDELQNRANIIRLYGMKDVNSLQELREARYEKGKVGKYDPITYFKDNVDRKYPIPYKIWHPINDPIVLIDYTEDFVQLVNKRENKIILERMNAGGHQPELEGGIVGEFVYMGDKYEINETMYSVGQFFSKYKMVEKLIVE